ncbi:MAG: FAD-dependent oxidoreductase [Spirochaetales bacterium]|nr:FAD-dependent oxidoreductase [Spirochaetales bacterium]
MKEFINDDRRSLNTIRYQADLVIAGGGLSGICAAITAAREGLAVILVQDRPVLGGNASSEVRLWALGATSHMGNNNRWSREGGVIDEIVVENLHRNPEGNPVLFDAVLLDKVLAEKNITLLLDTAVFQLDQNEEGSIKSVRAFCSQNATMYDLSAPLFCDASGDGILGYLSGADFRVGAEDKEEFNEPLAPDEFYGELLGHTIYFYSKDAGTPVTYVAPDFALKDITKIPRFNRIKASDTGCSFWWLEYGGRLDTVHDNQDIKKELWRVTYGIWDYIKNSGNFPEAENLTLEWVGLIPGKRESRRFEGDYMLHQSDITEHNVFKDAVSYGGWAVDLHPADGLYTDISPCSQYHSKGVYQIPWRCYYSRNIPNLFIAGRLISASHVAFGSTRVMMTCAHGAQAIGLGASLCLEKKILPRELSKDLFIRDFQKRLIRTGQYIPFLDLEDEDDLACSADIQVSSELVLNEIPGSGEFSFIDHPIGILLPLPSSELPEIRIPIHSAYSQRVSLQLRKAEKEGNYSPEIILEEQDFYVTSQTHEIAVKFEHREYKPYYGFLVLISERPFEIETSFALIPGLITLYHELNDKVAKSAVQTAPQGSGVHSFEFWLPHRRPATILPALSFSPGLSCFSGDGIKAGFERPWHEKFGWVPDPGDQHPEMNLSWKKPVAASKVILSFDTDFDHSMETVQMGHGERHIPNCVRHFILTDEMGKVIMEEKNNYQSRITIDLADKINIKSLKLKILSTWGDLPAIFRIRVVP